MTTPPPSAVPHSECEVHELRRRGRQGCLRMVVLLLVAFVPAAITVVGTREPRPFAFPTAEGQPNPTPFGYTRSLLLFLVPCAVFGVWLLRLTWTRAEAWAYGFCLVTLTALGFVLDLAFASLFLTFENAGAVLGWHVPGLAWSPFGFGFPIPIEEFVFYLSGFICVLSLYVWASEEWCARDQVPDVCRSIGPALKLTRWHPRALFVGAGLIAAACAWKYLGPHGWSAGFPGYFTFLVVASVAPTVLLLGLSVAYINWQAFSLALFYTLAVSVLWEAVLGVPYRWWGYQESQMLGLYVRPVSNLPLEAVLVWIAVTWTTVSLYEAVHLWLSLPKADRHRLLANTAGLKRIAPIYARRQKLAGMVVTDPR